VWSQYGGAENAGLELNGPKIEGWKMSEGRNTSTKMVIQVCDSNSMRVKNVHAATIKEAHNYEMSMQLHTSEMHIHTTLLLNFITEHYCSSRQQ